MASRARRVFWWLMVSTLFPYPALAARLQAQTLRAWEQYQRLTEARIRREVESSEGFLVRDFFEKSDSAAVRKTIENGGVFIKTMKTPNEEGGEIEIPKGIVHHWYGSVFVPGATVDEVLAWEQHYDNHENYFDEVEDSRLDSHRDDTFEIFLRLRRKKVITVHYNTEHRVTYQRFGDGAVASRSESTRIAEIENPGTEREREKPVENDRGFLWRLNSYWRFLQAPEGVIVECESISLSRTIPLALQWMVKPFINSVPRESLEATLLPLRDAFALASELQPETLGAWERYEKLTEARIDRELRSEDRFLVRDSLGDSVAAAVGKTHEEGEIFLDRIKTQNEDGSDIEIPNGLVHHWYGSVLLRDVELDGVLEWVQDYENYRDNFEEIEDSRLISGSEDAFDIFLRMRREAEMTLRYNTDHHVAFDRHGLDRVSSRSKATRIVELDQAGTDREREKPLGHGLLWRLNSYWRFQQVEQGVIVECEALTLSRPILVPFPTMADSFINAVPRRSLEATLQTFLVLNEQRQSAARLADRYQEISAIPGPVRFLLRRARSFRRRRLP